ncbi:serine/arginine repetitive matrix protein 1-like isoform X2 [Pararge aegeria]|uniref:serine/arginine repetitive matrix protein 1-like isoform X2 n=1 Tax=Pararge aegeria TaxID=116150 RepID=UPI0019D0C838|nr:serine/arginine repetitive matrix protein 1-like isoform X2 [Pararge aegeria]
MAEDNDLREKNNEMVKAVQHWKMTAAQKENEKLELKKEVNELRFKLSRLRNAESTRARKLNAELQSASEEVLSQLVQASSTVARMLELVKSFMQDREQLESAMPRWSNLANTPSNEKVNRVYPMVINGRHLQPVVALRRNEHIAEPPNMNISMRAVPLHMLQVYVPLTRIDARRASRNAERPTRNADANAEATTPNDSTEDLALDDGSEGTDQSSDQEEFQEEDSSRLEVVAEELEMGDETPTRAMIDDPMEGPSWLLDLPRDSPKINKQSKLEPDSTTEIHETEPLPGPSRLQVEIPPQSVSASCEFTPTVRRRKRATPTPPASPRSPHFSPRPARRNSKDGRVLKVLVAKLRLDDDEGGSGDASPPKRANLTQAPTKKPIPTETPPRHNPTELSIRPTKRPNEVPLRKLNHAEVSPKRANTSESQQKPQKIFHRRRSPESPKRQARSPAARQSKDGSPICQVRDLTPSQLRKRFDAPSPNGSTDSRVIVLEAGKGLPEPCCSGVSRSRTLSRTNSRENHSKHNKNSNHDNHDNQRPIPASQPNHDNIDEASQPRHSNNDNHRSNPASQPRHNKNDNHRTNPASQPDKANPASQPSNSNNENQRTEPANQPSNSKNDNHRTNPASQPNQANPSKHNRRACDNSSQLNVDTPNTSTYNHDEFNHVSDDRHSRVNRSRLDSHNDNRTSRDGNHTGRNDAVMDSDSSNSDVAEGRTRRARRTVVYKEKPLNRKMRR